MLVKPNKTVIQGRVLAITPDHDGHGSTLKIRVLRNESPRKKLDFIKPSDGSVLNVYASEAGTLSVGDLVRAVTTLLAGPFGERVVLEDVKPLPKSATHSP